MKLLDIVRMALFSLGVNKLRSGLALLGIVIGVTAVITLMSIGKGVQDSITSRLESLGTNLIFVMPEEETSGQLTLRDVLALQSDPNAKSIGGVAPEVSGFLQVAYQNENKRATIMGVTANYHSVRNAPIDKGSFISSLHLSNISNVAVLGYGITEELFQDKNPVGKKIKIAGKRFTVIGILKSKGGESFSTIDDRVLVPLTTAHYRLNYSKSLDGEIEVDVISVEAKSPENIDEAISEIVNILRVRHKITEEDDFRVTNMQEALEALESATNAIVFFLGSIAGISLLVGGIGVMNIMLVSVTERTREIGVRKALGARRIDVLFQFVSEATLLSMGGGGFGVFLGFMISKLLNGIPLGDNATLETTFSGDIALLALTVSASIGLFFGIFPAFRAGRLHPIEALRYQ